MKYLTSILALVTAFAASAQKYSVAEKIDMTVLGTSTLHDWEMEATSGSGYAYIDMENGQLKDITSLRFEMKAEGLKSGKSAMDDIAYEALKTEDHPKVSFVMRDVLSITNFGSQWKIRARGNLTIAGKTRLETITVTASRTSEGLVFTGTHDIKMTEFDMKPPTAMFGTIKTGDDLKINWRVVYTNGNNS